MTIAQLRSSHAFRCQLLIAAIPLIVFVGHSVLYALGKMASNGELRYMLIVAPFWALLAAKGWECVWERFAGNDERGTMNDERTSNSSFLFPPSALFSPRSPFLYAAVAAVVPVFANVGYKVLPLVQSEDWKTAAKIAEWYKSSGVERDYPRVMASHPGVTYALDRAPLDSMMVTYSRQTVNDRPIGTFLVWDPMYGRFNADQAKSMRWSTALAAGWWCYGVVDAKGYGMFSSGGTWDGKQWQYKEFVMLFADERSANDPAFNFGKRMAEVQKAYGNPSNFTRRYSGRSQD